MKIERYADIQSADNGFIINLSAHNADDDDVGRPVRNRLVCTSIAKLVKILKTFFSAEIVPEDEEEEELATFDEEEGQPLPDIAE